MCMCGCSVVRDVRLFRWPSCLLTGVWLLAVLLSLLVLWACRRLTTPTTVGCQVRFLLRGRLHHPPVGHPVVREPAAGPLVLPPLGALGLGLCLVVGMVAVAAMAVLDGCTEVA